MTFPVHQFCPATGKIMYSSSKAAMQASVEFQRRKLRSTNRRGFAPGERALHSYHCAHCSAYHIGHMTGKAQPEKQKMHMAKNWKGNRR